MFTWRLVTAGLAGPPTSLQIRGYEVARLGQRVDGTWLATVRRNLPPELQRTHVCASYESGRAGCEAWAQRHAAQLEAWASGRETEWVSQQRWRGATPVAAPQERPR